MIPVGKGLLSRAKSLRGLSAVQAATRQAGVMPPSIVDTQVVPVPLIILFSGSSIHATVVGSQKIPYPPRRTVFWFNRYAKPNLGPNILLLGSSAVRLERSGELTSPSLPFNGRPVGAASGLSASGKRTASLSKRSEKDPGRSQRATKFRVSLFVTWNISPM